MAKRVDLNQKKDNSNFRKNRSTHPTMQRNNQTNDNLDSEEQNLNQSENVASISNNLGRSSNGSKKNNLFSKLLGSNSFEKSSGGEKFKALMKNPVTRKIIVIMGLVALVFLLLVYIIMVITGADDDSSNDSSMAIGGYYDMRCPEVTVIFTDKSKGYEVTGSGTYSLEEYIAGVIGGEVGYLGNLELDKELAIAARSYFFAVENDCTIESSDRKQVFKKLTDYWTDQLARQAAEETKGQVLLKDNQIFLSEYDAFCSIAVDDNYYTIKQANQKIPRSWVDSQRGIIDEWKQGTCAGNHGRGLSQFGGLYLATEKGYTYDQLLSFYLGDEVTISSGNGFSLTEIPGLEIKNTTNSSNLHEKLTTYLPANGSSINELNTFIKNNVKENGAGTREGVVTAAVSLINYLYDGFGVSLPYYWGGQYQYVGVNPSFGGITSPSTTPGGYVYNYSGFDCSGFASWAIKNGGYNFARHTTSKFHAAFAGNSCNIADSNCIGQPGDLINSESCHVQMIVSVDEASGKYYVAESTGSYGLIMRPWNMHTSNCGNKETRILHMDSFYNNQANIDTNY